MQLIINIIVNVLTMLYRSMMYSMVLAFFVMFNYLYACKAENSGKGWRSSVKDWIVEFRTSILFRKSYYLSFSVAMIAFQTLFNRNMWQNPLEDVMGGWWIWKTASDGAVSLTTECFENIALILPFILLLLWTAKEKILKRISLVNMLWSCTKISFLFSFSIEILQLFLRLGTFQLSDLFYNTLGGFLGGLIYWFGCKEKSRKSTG